MSDLERYNQGGGQLSTPLSGLSGGSGGLRNTRGLNREIARTQGAGLIRATKIDVESTLDQLRVSAAGAMVRTAQSEIAMLTEMEANLTAMVPLAGRRLEMIGNIAAIGMGELVADDANAEAPVADVASDTAPTTKRVVLYLRVSTRGQVETDYDPEGISIPAQRKACQRKADQLGYQVVGEYIEPGKSATTIKNRVALQDLLTRIKTDRDIDVLMVHKLSRFARNRWDDALLGVELEKYGVTLMSATEAIDDTPEGQFMRGILASMAEFRSRQDGADIAYKMSEKAKNGGTLGMAPLGYLNVIETFEGRRVRTVTLDPERAELITWLFTQYATGKWSHLRLADAVTARGLTTRPTAKRPARPITFKVVQSILQNRYYLGEVTYKGVAYPGRHEPLTDPATFQKVQDTIAAHRLSGEKPQKHWHYLAGSLKCARCGKSLVYNVITGRSGKYDYYTCIGRMQKSTDCDLPYLPTERVEEAVERLWRLRQIPTWVVDRIEADLMDHIDEIAREQADEADKLTRRIGALNDERVKWADAVMNGTVPADIARDKQDTLGQQLAALEQQVAAIEDSNEIEKENITRALAIVRTAASDYGQAAPQLRRCYNQTWFRKIEVDDKEGQPVVTDVAVQEPLQGLDAYATHVTQQTVGGVAMQATGAELLPNAPTTTPERAAQPGIADVASSEDLGQGVCCSGNDTVATVSSLNLTQILESSVETASSRQPKSHGVNRGFCTVLANAPVSNKVLLVEHRGFEPLTSSMPSRPGMSVDVRRSPDLAELRRFQLTAHAGEWRRTQS